MEKHLHMEIEAKIAIDDPHVIEAELAQLGAKRQGRYIETDTFFDDKDHRLQSDDSALRLRDRKDIDTGLSTFRLTYKGPRQAGPFKHRREVEFGVDSPENVRALLESLGYQVMVGYTKRRNSWFFDGCCIEVDSLEGIGDFVEVEGPDESCIRRVVGALKLENRPIIQESYLAMVLSKP